MGILTLALVLCITYLYLNINLVAHSWFKRQHQLDVCSLSGSNNRVPLYHIEHALFAAVFCPRTVAYYDNQPKEYIIIHE